jgi:cobalamin synthase
MERLAGRAQVNKGFVVGMAAYTVLVVLAVLVLNAVDDPAPWIGVALAVPPVAAAVYAITSQFRWIRRQEGVERTAMTDAAAWSFYVVALSALAYFFVEAWADAPKLSMIWVWLYGMAAFFVANLLATRRFR